PGGTLTPLNAVKPLLSNEIKLTEKRPPFSAYFNRGIVATQALSHALNNKPSIPALTPHIQNPADPIRIRLMGQLSDGVTELLNRADKEGGTINGALYELNSRSRHTADIAPTRTISIDLIAASYKAPATECLPPGRSSRLQRQLDSP